MRETSRATDKKPWVNNYLDDAGQNGIVRALPQLLKEGFTVLVVESRGEDPADVIQRVGPQNIVQYIKENSKPAIQLVMDREIAKMEAIVNQERVKALNKILPIIDSIQKPAEKFNYEGVLRTKLGLG